MTTPQTTVPFVGAKGGVGTSTVAAIYALTIARGRVPGRARRWYPSAAVAT